MGVAVLRRRDVAGFAATARLASAAAAAMVCVAAANLVGCKSSAPPRLISAIGIATDSRTATAQTRAGERAKKNLALLLRAEGARFTYVSQGPAAAVEAEREGRAKMIRTQYRSIAKNTWLAEAKAPRSAEVVEALRTVPFREHDVTIRDNNLVRAYRRAEASLFRAIVEAAIGTRDRPTFVTGKITFVELTPEVGEDWVRLAARARVQVDQERPPTSAELARLRPPPAP